MSQCDNLSAFIDGELTAAEADAYREHLKTCEQCGRDLPEIASLQANISTLVEEEQKR